MFAYAITAVLSLQFLWTSAIRAQGQPPTLADSWNGVHSWLSLRINGNYSNAYLASIAWRYDFASSFHSAAMVAANPQLIGAVYRSGTQDNNGHGLAWYQANHPDWLLYDCSRQLVLTYGTDGPNLDFTNPAVIDYQYASFAPFGPNNLLDNIWLDNDYPNFGRGIYYQACGVYDFPGHFVQKFAGIGSYATIPDPNFTNGMINFLSQIRTNLHARGAPLGPGLLFVNSDPKVVASNANFTTSFLNSIDGVQTEGGQWGWEYPGDLWLNNIKFIERSDDLDRGVYQQLCPTAATEATIPPAYIRYALAAYLLSKGHHTAIKINPSSDCGYYENSSNIFWPQEFETTHNGSGVSGATGIGTPCARMSIAAGPSPSIYGIGLYMREYSGGVALVNTSLAGGVSLGTSYTAALPPGSTYKDIYGNPIGSPVTVPPMAGLILLKTSGAVCSNGVGSSFPVISGISVTSVTSSSATIGWITDRQADGQIEFFNQCPSGGCSTPLVTALTTSHSINVTGLSPNTLYTFRIKSKDSSANLTISSNQSFTTLPNSAVSAFSGTPQSAQISTAFGSALKAKVTDSFSNPLVGVAVTFTAPASGASATFSGANSIVVNTDGSGIATTPVPVANGTAGAYNVSASAAGISTPATFTLTNTPPALPGTAVTIFGNLAPQTFGSDLSSVELGVKFRSDVNGSITGIRFYKGSADHSPHTGSLWSVAGTLLATGTFQNETASGWQQMTFLTPVSIAANTTYVASYHTSGGYFVDGNYFKNTGFDNPPLHALKDGTDGFNGVYAYGTGGVFPNESFISCSYWADVLFVPSGTVVPQSIVTVSGTPQTTTVGTAFASALQAKVTDASTNPVANVPVTFTAPSSGAGATFGATNSVTVNTNSSGVAASPVPAANNAPGGYSVTASVTGLSPATFSLSNTAGSPQSIVTFSGTPQSANVGTAFGSTLQAKVTDAFTNPIAGVAVTFTAPSSGASATFGGTNSVTVNTNGSGIATSSALTANNTAGGYNVTASVAGVATPATFSLTNTNTSAGNGVTIFSTIVPQSNVMDSPVEVGVKFRTDVNGSIMGIRFYKASFDQNGHTGSLWSAAGTLLATGTFQNETTSGWQQMSFSTPVSIVANTTYVASYHTNRGYYYSGNYFLNTGFDNAPLHALKTGVSGANGVYVYGPGGVFPTQSYQSTNYWADVMFVPSTPSTPQAIVEVSGTPQSAIVGTAFAGALQAKVTDASANPVANVPVTFAAPSSGASATFGGATSVTINTNSTGVATSPVPAANNTSGGYIVSASVAGVATTASFSLTNTTPSGANQTIFGTAAPQNFYNDSPVEIGVKFRSDIGGIVTGVRFYKDSSDQMIHTGSLWSATGTLLASGTFQNETASGWQQMTFSTPVSIVANTTYVASYHTGKGYFASDNYFRNAGFDNGPLHALRDGTDGVNGVYVYGAGGVFPTQGFQSSNYWADVVFVPAGIGSPQGVVAVSGTPQAMTVGKAFGNALQAKVADALANPIANEPVTFSAPSSGASATFSGTNSVTVNTNSAGLATSPVPAANNTAGSYNVTATVAGVATPATFSLTNAPAGSAFTIYGTLAPQTVVVDSPAEVGVKFRSDVNGSIIGIRYYKASFDQSIHTGSLWSATGTLLATGTFTGGTASGWQQLTFSTPVPIAANTTYVASYHTGGPYYASVNYFQNTAYDNAPLHALKDGTDGFNGVYVYGPGGVFPNQSFQSTNYWVDVVFVPN